MCICDVLLCVSGASRIGRSKCATLRYFVSVFQQVRLPQLRLLHEGIQPARDGAGLPPTGRRAVQVNEPFIYICLVTDACCSRWVYFVRNRGLPYPTVEDYCAVGYLFLAMPHMYSRVNPSVNLYSTVDNCGTGEDGTTRCTLESPKPAKEKMGG